MSQSSDDPVGDVVGAPDPPAGRALADTERWFVEHGVPHFIEDYRAREDILNRAMPALLAVFFISTLFVFREEWEGWVQAVIVAATFGGLVLLWVVVNVAMGRPLFAPPSRVTGFETVVIVVAPPLVAVVIGQHVLGAIALLLVQAGLIGIIYLSASYAVLPIVHWAGRQILRQAGDVARVLTRGLPLLLLFTTFLFINAEVWQMSAALSPLQLSGVLVLFGLVAVVFVAVWLADELDRVDAETDAATVRRWCAGTPIAGVLDGRDPAPDTLSRKQRLNMLLVLVTSQIVQALLVALAVFLFYVAFGWLAIDGGVQARWLGGDVDPAALFKVAALLAMFSALYFAVYAVTDTTYREQFFAPIRRHMEQAMAVRAAYLTVYRATSGSVSSSAARSDGNGESIST